MLNASLGPARRSSFGWRRVGAFGVAIAFALVSCGDDASSGGPDPDPKPLDKDCSGDADCKVIDGCCAGCQAASVGVELDACDSTCFQSACDAAHGAGAVVSAVCTAGTCELEVQPAPGDTPCEVAADCKVQGDCCSGCVALHVDETLPDCLKGCADPACATSHGAPFVATCRAGRCEIADASCEMASDCKVVNDCCLGCVAMPTDSPLPPCEAQCDQDACSAEYGSDAEISASCDANECSLLVALP